MIIKDYWDGRWQQTHHGKSTVIGNVHILPGIACCYLVFQSIQLNTVRIASGALKLAVTSLLWLLAVDEGVLFCGKQRRPFRILPITIS